MDKVYFPKTKVPYRIGDSGSFIICHTFAKIDVSRVRTVLPE